MAKFTKDNAAYKEGPTFVELFSYVFEGEQRYITVTKSGVIVMHYADGTAPSYGKDKTLVLKSERFVKEVALLTARIDHLKQLLAETEAELEGLKV